TSQLTHCNYLLVVLARHLPHPRSPLFPYTTLFRSDDTTIKLSHASKNDRRSDFTETPGRGRRDHQTDGRCQKAVFHDFIRSPRNRKNQYSKCHSRLYKIYVQNFERRLKYKKRHAAGCGGRQDERNGHTSSR